MSDEERTRLLNEAIRVWQETGWAVESQSAFSATIVKGNKTNHILHLLLSIFTFGLWLIVWFSIVAFGGQRKQVITIDEYGR